MKRIYHTFDKWECYPAGFYEAKPAQDLTQAECQEIYRAFLQNQDEFCAALERVTAEWVKSCEHYLSNEKMNRIAWLGQASLCIAKGIPSAFRGGFHLLTEDEQARANNDALRYLNAWLVLRGEPPVTLEGAGIKAKADLY